MAGGVPIDTFPDEPFRGWLWPAAGVVWHLVPVSTRPLLRCSGRSSLLADPRFLSGGGGASRRSDAARELTLRQPAPGGARRQRP